MKKYSYTAEVTSSVVVKDNKFEKYKEHNLIINDELNNNIIFVTARLTKNNLIHEVNIHTEFCSNVEKVNYDECLNKLQTDIKEMELNYEFLDDFTLTITE